MSGARSTVPARANELDVEGDVAGKGEVRQGRRVRSLVLTRGKVWHGGLVVVDVGAVGLEGGQASAEGRELALHDDGDGRDNGVVDADRVVEGIGRIGVEGRHEDEEIGDRDELEERRGVPLRRIGGRLVREGVEEVGRPGAGRRAESHRPNIETDDSGNRFVRDLKQKKKEDRKKIEWTEDEDRGGERKGEERKGEEGERRGSEEERTRGQDTRRRTWKKRCEKEETLRKTKEVL